MRRRVSKTNVKESFRKVKGSTGSLPNMVFEPDMPYQNFPRTYRGLHGDVQMNLGGNTIFRPLLDGRFFITIF